MGQIASDQIHLDHLGACRSAFAGSAPECANVLLVGELNPISGSPSDALYCAPVGCSGHRLQEVVLGIPRLHYLAMWRTNLCHGSWSLKLARERAAKLLSPDVPWRTIVMLGREVEKAFGFSVPKLQHRFIPVAGRSFEIIALPHPSGLCHDWNAIPGAVNTARDLMCRAESGIPWGCLP